MTLSGSKILKAAALAITLGAAAVTSMPAQAASFNIQFGSGGYHRDNDRHDRYDRRDRHPTCLTDYQVRQRIGQYGYDNIYLNVANDHHIQAKASRGRTTYLIDFNRCTGRIEGTQRLRTVVRPERPHRPDRHHYRGPGFFFGQSDDKDEAGDLH